MVTLCPVNALKNGSFDFKTFSGRMRQVRNSNSSKAPPPFNCFPCSPSPGSISPASLIARYISPFMEGLPRAMVAVGLLLSFSSSSIFQASQASSSELLDKFPK